MKTPLELERRLREEAREPGPPPSPHLHTRIMAEVTSLPAEGGRPPAHGAARLLAAAVVVLVCVTAGIYLASRSGPTAPGQPWTKGGYDVALPVVPMPEDLPEVLANPFGHEVAALATDAERATRFLVGCIPL